MPFTLRKLIFTALILTALLHEPTFKLFINILVNVHIFARKAFDVLREFIDAPFSAIASWAISTFHDARIFFVTQIERPLSVIEPVTRLMGAKMVEWAKV
jgi:hypothetical protein